MLLLILPIFFFSGCGQEETLPPSPHIILITIDTLRADHLSCYGYSRQTSPFIDTLARESVVFNRAYSTSSWTAPSMASIFTGLYPRSHGVLHGVAAGPKAVITGQEKLVRQMTTLAEVLKEAGYTTFGVSSNGHLSRATGFGQGFDYYATHWFMKSPATNHTVKKWLKTIRQAPKYFLWVHYFDPHNPYAPRLPWYKTYITQSKAFSRWQGEVMSNPDEYIEEVRNDPKALQILIDRYDSEINYCDYHIRELFELLQPDANTLVVISADHGEGFLDHNWLLHGNTLFEEETRVPLIIRFPGKQWTGSYEPPVSNRDIFSTITDWLKLDTRKKIPGKSLIPLISGTGSEPREDIYCELDWNGWAKAIHSGNWKLILSGRDKKEMLLFDLQADPRETRTLFDRYPDKARLLESRLNQWLSLHKEFKAPKIHVKVDKANEDKLKTLGYL